MAKIHYLQHVPFETLSAIEAWGLKSGHIFTSTKLFQNQPLPSIRNMDAVIILGGPMGVHDDKLFPWLVEEKLWIEQVLKQGKPVLGICLGSQILASVLGSKVYKNSHKEIGWFPVTWKPEAKNISCFKELDSPFTVFQWHGDTFDIPNGAIHLATSDGCQNQAFLYQEKVLALQFHMEATPESVRILADECENELVDGQSYIQNKNQIINTTQYYSAIHHSMENCLNYLFSN
ncbi:MAG: type 1 glutamine amidotransferase [SAR324 cluster bacterium]|nr:type 1 glutamine amidotransferase [SAR324 cluster bacterium]